MARTGRPKAEIDKTQFEKLCAMQCTEAEICGFFNVTDKTLMNWVKREYGADLTFSEILKSKGAVGKISLRRSMMKNATENNNAAVQIFLAKNLLGMADNPDNEEVKRQRLEFDIEKEQQRIVAEEAVYEDDGFIKALNAQVPDTWEDFEGTERSADNDKE